MPKDMSADTRIEAVAGKAVELPNGNFVANAEMTRAGTDLHLTGPDGHTIIVEGYFAQMPAPDLVTHDGARVTPAMVSAFVPPEHAGQYAASGQIANDASPAGKITQVVGEAHIIHADGTKILATVGALIFQGDVVETSKTGAVNIQFADNTTFAISESARMSVDQFVYHSADHSGSTFFSMLQGVFVYTSGLIGKTDPGSVNIETPVGSIGIRGTVVAGHILPAGQNSQITIVDGAVTLTNGSGTQEMNTNLATVSLNSYQSQPESVPMDAGTFNNSYHSVSSVASDTLNHFTGMTAPAPSTEHAPANTAPAATGSGSEAAPAAAAPAPTTTHAPAAAPAAPAPAPTAPTGSAAPAPSSTDSSTQAAANTATAPAATTTSAPATTTTAPAAPADTTTAPATTTAAAPAATPVAPVDTTTAAPPPPASATSTFSSGSTTSGASDSASAAGTFAAPPAAGNAAGTAAGTTAAPPATETTAAPPAGTTTTTPPAGTTTTPPAETPLQLAVSAALASATATFSAASAAAATAATVHADALAAANSATAAQTAATAAAVNSATDPTDAAAAQTSATAATALATAAHNADVDAAGQATAAHNAATSANNAYQAALATTDAPTAQAAAATAATYATVAQAAATAAAADLTSTAAATASAATDATQAQTSLGLVATAVSASLSASVSAVAASAAAAHSADLTSAAHVTTIHTDATTAGTDATAAQTAATTASANSLSDSTDATAAQTSATAAAAAATAANNDYAAAITQGSAASVADANAAADLTAAQAATNPAAAQTDVTAAANAYTAANTAANAVAVDLANATAALTTAAADQTAAQTSEGLVATAVTTALAAAVTFATNTEASANAAVQAATTAANNANASYTTASNDAATVSTAYTNIQSQAGAFPADISALQTANTSAQAALSNATAANADAATQLSNAQAAYAAAQTALINTEAAQAASNVSAAQAAASGGLTDADTAETAATTTATDMTAASNDANTAAAAVTATTAFRLDSVFSTAYTNNTPGTTLDDGVKEFAAAGTVISQITPVNSGVDTITYAVTVLNTNSPVDTMAGGYTPALSSSSNAVFSINGSGNLVVDDPLALSGYNNAHGIMINIAATDTTTNTTVNDQMLIQIHNEPSLTQFTGEVDANNVAPVLTTVSYTGTTNAQLITANGLLPLTLSDGGYTGDVFLGDGYNDTFAISNNAFQYINAGSGTFSTLELTAPMTLDFTAGTLGTVTNIQDISLASASSSITLDNQDIAAITGTATTPTLEIDTSQGSVVINNAAGTSAMGYSSSLFEGQDGYTIDGTYYNPTNGQYVYGMLFTDTAGDKLFVTPDGSGDGGGGTGPESGAGIGTAMQLTAGGANDLLGDSVAISGNNIVIGGEAGNAYVEDLATSQSITLTNPGSPSNYFGQSVAISGNTVAVGAEFSTTYASPAGGAVYVYTLQNGTATLNTSADTLVNSMGPAANAAFGDSVAVSGNLIVAGAHGATVSGFANAGQAYVYDLATNTALALNTSGTAVANAGFGADVAASGNIILVSSTAGDGTVYEYQYNPANNTDTLLHTFADPKATSGDEFGGGLAYGGGLAISGNIIVIGASYTSDTGASSGIAYEYNATTGALMQTFHNPGTGSYFGSGVSISDGTIVIGEGGGNEAYVYNAYAADGTAPIGTLLLPGGTGGNAISSVAISGNSAVVGDADNNSFAGTAYAYTNATTGAQVTVEGANAGNYTAFQVSDFAGTHSVVGTLGPAADSYQILGGDSAYHLITAGGFTTTESSTASSTPFAIVGNQLVVNDPTALFADQVFTLNVENMTTSTSTTVSVFSSDPFSPGIYAQGELMDTTSGGQTVTGTSADQIIWGGTGTTSDTLSDGGFTGDVLIGSNAGNNTIDVSNSGFALADGGAGSNNTLGLYNLTTSTAFTLDFTSVAGSAKNINAIDLGYSSFGGVSNGNSVTLNAQDVFDMTNSADNHTLSIEQQNGVSNSAVNVVTSNTNAALDFTASPNNGAAGTTQTYTGAYNGTNVTLVIYDSAASGSNHIAVHAVA